MNSIVKKVLIILAILAVIIAAAFYSLTNYVEKNSDKVLEFAYKHNLKSIKCKECVKHFPKEIPSSDINTVKYSAQILSDEHPDGIYLQVDVDEKYIKEELAKYRFVNVVANEQINGYRALSMVYANGTIDLKNYKFYLIYDNDDHTTSYGIGVAGNTIVYFYAVY